MYFKKPIIDKINETYFRQFQGTSLFPLKEDLINITEFKEAMFSLQGKDFKNLSLGINSVDKLLQDLEYLTPEKTYAKSKIGNSLLTNYKSAYSNIIKRMKKFSSVTCETISVLRSFKEDSYIVGGFVRDTIADKSYNDIDFCTSISYEELSEKFVEAGFLAKDVGKQFLVLNVYKDLEHFEIAALRSDMDNSGPVRGTIEEDAKRRDFVNSCIYFSLKKVELIDPSGEAIKDCKNNVLRFMGKPKDRIKEDTARVFRGYKMIGRGWEPDKKTLKALRENFEYALRKTSATRVMNEIEKMVGL